MSAPTATESLTLELDDIQRATNARPRTSGPTRCFASTIDGRSAVHTYRIKGIGAFNENRDPSFNDPDY